MSELHASRIVVVDDHVAVLSALKELLELEGFRSVEVTTEPTRVLSAVEREAVDLVILDARMPGVDGFELIQEIQDRTTRETFLPILMVTAHASTAVTRLALASGAHDFVVKPFDPGEILLRIKNLLTTRALHVELDRHRRDLETALRGHEEDAVRRQVARDRKRALIEQALRPGALRLVFQPVFDLARGDLLGVECLTRFDIEPVRPPDQWFADAEEVGLAAELQFASIAAGVAMLPLLPAPAFLAVNLSPAILAHPGLPGALGDADLSRVVLELTEHDPVRDYPEVHAALAPLRAKGARLAIDDAGAGYASFQHILRLRPDIIKLDRDLTRGIDGDPIRRALAAALLVFGDEIDARLVAEGVETAAELEALRALGFGGAQGFYLGRPTELADALVGEGHRHG